MARKKKVKDSDESQKLTPTISGASPVIQKMQDELADLNKEMATHKWRYYHTEYEGVLKKIDCRAPRHILEASIDRYQLADDERKKVLMQGAEIRKLSARVNSLRQRLTHALQKANKPGYSILHKEIVDLFADFCTPKEIVNRLTRQGHVISLLEVETFYGHHKKEIEHRKHTRADQVLEGSVGSEQGRLHVLSELMSQFYQSFQRAPNDKDAKMMLQILEAARKETKAQEIKLTIDGHIDINATKAAGEALDLIKGRFAFFGFVVSKAAFDMGRDPVKVLNMLSNSYYRKYNGFGGAPAMKQEKVESYLSQATRQYDWDRIKKLNESFSEDVEEAEIVEDVDREILRRGEQLRKILLTMGRGMRDDVNSGENRGV